MAAALRISAICAVSMDSALSVKSKASRVAEPRPNRASGFGAAGSVVALLLWVYYSAQIFFFGAEFTHQFALRFGSLRRYRRLLL